MLLLGTINNVQGKDYLSFKKSTRQDTPNKQVFQDGKAMQISQKAQSVAILCIEKTAAGENEVTALLSIALEEGAEEVTFDPETVVFEAFDGKKTIPMQTQNPENYKLRKEKQARKANMWAKIGTALNATNGVDASLQNMNNKSDFKDHMSTILASASEFMQITTLSVAGQNEVGGKIIFIPVKGNLSKKTQYIKATVTVGNEVHEFYFDASIIKI